MEVTGRARQLRIVTPPVGLCAFSSQLFNEAAVVVQRVPHGVAANAFRIALIFGCAGDRERCAVSLSRHRGDLLRATRHAIALTLFQELPQQCCSRGLAGFNVFDLLTQRGNHR